MRPFRTNWMNEKKEVEVFVIKLLGQNAIVLVTDAFHNDFRKMVEVGISDLRFTQKQLFIFKTELDNAS